MTEYINHKEHGHAISGPEGKKAREECRKRLADGRHPRVESAYYDGKYTDKEGNEWRRGMDGWFLDNIDGKGGVMLSRHDDFVALVERENP